MAQLTPGHEGGMNGISVENQDKFNLSSYESRFFNAITTVVTTACYYSFRPNWLKNEKTGHNYEIDFYFPYYRFGFEIQGEYHYGRDAEHHQYNDMKKQELAEKVDIPIIEVFPQQLKSIERSPLDYMRRAVRPRVNKKTWTRLKKHMKKMKRKRKKRRKKEQAEKRHLQLMTEKLLESREHKPDDPWNNFIHRYKD